MKSIVKIGLSLASCLFLFSACDYIANPLLPHTTVKINTSLGDTTQKILVEDYTGMYCEHCPTMATAIEQLIAQYGNRIVPLAVNYGFYATPPQPAPYNGWDFTTPAGNAYGDIFITASGSFPNGMVNRLYYPKGLQNCNCGDASILTSKADSMLTANPGRPSIYIAVNTSFNVATSVLTVTATTTFLQSYLSTQKYALTLLLTQDSIIAPQKDTVGALDATYPHRYALRDAINGIWGDTLAHNNTSITKTYSYILQTGYPASPGSGCPKIPSNYKQSYVVAYVYDCGSSSTTQYQVMQAQYKKIYP